MSVCSNIGIQWSSSSPLVNNTDKVYFRSITDGKLWGQYIWNYLAGIVGGFHYSLHDVFTMFGKQHPLHYLCDMLWTMADILMKPCGILRHETRMEINIEWVISVNQLFMINVTIDKAYVRYSDTCGGDYVAVYEGSIVDPHSKLSQYCGHILYETVYTKGYKALFVILGVSQNHVVIQAMYQIHTRGTAYKFNGTVFANGSWHNITSNHSPLWVYFSSTLDYIWYYTVSPLYNYDSPYVTFSAVQVEVHIFTCKDNETYVELRHGIIPHIWLERRGGQTHHCNTTQWMLQMTEHRFLTILLRSNPADHTLVFVMHLQYPLAIRQYSVLPSARVEGSHLVHAVIYERILVVGRFSFTGFLRNIQANQVYSVAFHYLFPHIWGFPGSWGKAPDLRKFPRYREISLEFKL